MRQTPIAADLFWRLLMTPANTEPLTQRILCHSRATGGAGIAFMLMLGRVDCSCDLW
jgi:hypothetical protein